MIPCPTFIKHPPMETTAPIKAFSGGTFQSRTHSPGNVWEVEGSDVGGVRRRQIGQTVWETMPTAGSDADRKVSGVVILDDGSIFALVGNGTSSGRIIYYDADCNPSVITTGLHIRANQPSVGDTDARTRPVGWTLFYDDTRQILYACTENGFYREDLTNPANSGIIGLAGESCRGFSHYEGTSVGVATQLFVATRTQGTVEVINPQGIPMFTAVGTPTRTEDIALGNGQFILTANHLQGVYKTDLGTGVTTNLTPTSALGANGDQAIWSAVDVDPASGIALAVMINPTAAQSWVWRSTAPLSTMTAADWEDITHTQMTLLPGVTYVQPPNRTTGGAATGGRGLTGSQHVSFLPGDLETIKLLGTLTTSITDNGADPNTEVVWESDVEASSLLTMVDVAVSDTGQTVIATADNNSMVGNDISTMTTIEPDRVGVAGLGDGYAVAECDGVWVLAPVDDADWQKSNNGWAYSTEAAPTTWISTGWETYDWNAASDFPPGLAPLPAGVIPRPVSLCGHEIDADTVRFHGAADGIGFVYQDYTKSTDTWSDPVISQGGPTDGSVISVRQNTARVTECKKDGSLILHILQSTGEVWRSLDQGATVQQITPAISAGPQLRTGYLRIHEETCCALVSNDDGIYLIPDATVVTPQSIQWSTETGPIAIDQITGRAFIHLRGAGRVRLVCVDDICNRRVLELAEDVDIEEYAKSMGDQANQLQAVNHNGRLYIITLYQGGGGRVSDMGPSGV